MQTNLVHVRSPVLTIQARFAYACPTIPSIPLAFKIVIWYTVIFDVHSSVHNPASPDHGQESSFYSIPDQNRITAPTSL